MGSIRFNHVFIALMVLSALCAFVIPQNRTGAVKDQVSGLFAPVQLPVKHMADAVHGWYAKPEPAMPGDAPAGQTALELKEELALRDTVIANLLAQQDELKKQSDQLKSLGDLRPYCTRFDVVAADAGTRESLQISGSARDGLGAGMAVICPEGLVGRIDHAGFGGARVQLITDPASKILGAFRRYRAVQGGFELVRLTTRPFGVDGAGPGKLLITALSWEDVKAAGVQPGDWVVVDDAEWPRAQGIKLGQVETIEKQKAAPLFAVLVVRPRADLRRLREVMVMNKKSG